MSGLTSNRPLAVGLNLVYLVEGSGGSGTYARELIAGMLEVQPDLRLTAFVSRELPESVRSATWAGDVEWVEFPIDVTHGPPYNIALTMAAQWGAVAFAARRRRLDVVHGLANVTPLVAPGVATVVTLLDLIWLRFPKTMARRATIGMRIVAPTSARAADRVIAISHASKRDLIESIGLAPEKVDVTPLGVRLREDAEATPASELRDELGLGAEQLVLCVAQKREHKNLLGLIRGLALIEDVNLQLVLPGSPTPHEQELRSLALDLGISGRVHFPGWVSAAQLEGLYRMAACFVLPSFEEGFGIPILEAMARGVPVACSNTTSLPEIAGDAAILFDPKNPQEIGSAIGRLISDGPLRRELIARGRTRCDLYTWQSTARATLATYRRAIEDRRLLRWR